MVSCLVLFLLSIFIILTFHSPHSFLYTSQQERQEKRNHAENVFGSLDNVQTPDDMGAGRRRRFCDDSFGRKQGGRQHQLQQESYSGGGSFGMRGQQSQRSDLYASAAGGGGTLTYGSAGGGMSSQNSYVLRGEAQRGEQAYERRGERKRAREVVRSDGEGDDGRMSQVLLVNEETASAQSSVTK